MQQTASPFDDVSAPGPLSSTGFDPILVPEAGLTGLQNAPVQLTQPDGSTGEIPTSFPARDFTTSPPIVWQYPPKVDPPQPTPTLAPVWIPDRIVIPAILLDAPVLLTAQKKIVIQGQTYEQWVAPDSFAVGMLTSASLLGKAGNTVLIGHHNLFGEVFGHLVDLKVGDHILVYSGDQLFSYVITMKMILPERFQPVNVRLSNAQWIGPSQDERLTLVTCWPFNSNTHRLVIVATPIKLSISPPNMIR
jgi:LPXTG-site transpeptidase (sortase) family protein